MRSIEIIQTTVGRTQHKKEVWVASFSNPVTRWSAGGSADVPTFRQRADADGGQVCNEGEISKHYLSKLMAGNVQRRKNSETLPEDSGERKASAIC